MKRKTFLMMLTFLLTLTFVGPVPAFAADVEVPPTQSSEESILRSDEYVTYYRTHNGVRQYRVWNITAGVWVTPWTDC